MALLFLLIVVLALLAFTAWVSYLALVFWILLVVMGAAILSGLSALVFLLGFGLGSALQSAPLGLALGALFTLVFWAWLRRALRTTNTRSERPTPARAAVIEMPVAPSAPAPGPGGVTPALAAVQTSCNAPDRN
jgi:hypothetical protein